MGQKVKNILITHAFGPDNRGDHELLEKLLLIIRKRYGREAGISVFTSFPAKSRQHFPDIDFYRSPVSYTELQGRIDKLRRYKDFLFWTLTLYVAPFQLFLSKRLKTQIRLIREADVIFMCPGGYLYSNRKSYYANILNGMMFKKAQPGAVMVSPMSIGPFYSRFDLNLCKQFLKHADKIFVRETFSQELVEQMGYKPILAQDLAWYGLDEEASPPYDASDNDWADRFVATVIDWDFLDTNDPVAYSRRYFDEMIRCSKVLYEQSGKKVILYNQVGEGKGKSKDEVLIQRLVEAAPAYIEYSLTEMTPAQLRKRLSKARGIIASRFHSALFSIQAEAPFITISYQPKAEYILKDLKLHHLSVDIKTFDGVALANKLVVLSADREAYRQTIQHAKKTSGERIQRYFIDEIPA